MENDEEDSEFLPDSLDINEVPDSGIGSSSERTSSYKVNQCLITPCFPPNIPFLCSQIRTTQRSAWKLKNSKRSSKRPLWRRPNPWTGKRRRLIGPQIVFYQWTKAQTARGAVLLVPRPYRPKIDSCPPTIWVRHRHRPCLPKSPARISINAWVFLLSASTARNPIVWRMEAWRRESKALWTKLRAEAPQKCTYPPGNL